MTKEFEVFQTPRLIIRQWIESDLKDILQVYGDPEVIRWVGDRVPLTEDQAKNWLEITKKNYEKRGYGMFTILDRNTRNTIGFGGLVHPGNSELPELKYAFKKSSWGQGFASEFVNGILLFAKDSLKLKKIIATTYPENSASNKVLLKCGFVHERVQLNEDGTSTSFFEVHFTSES